KNQPTPVGRPHGICAVADSEPGELPGREVPHSQVPRASQRHAAAVRRQTRITVRKSRSLRRFFITAPVDPCESDEIALDIALCINERSVRCNVEIRAAASSHCDFRKHGLWTSNGREVAQIEPDSLEPSLRSVDEMSALQIPRMSATFEQNLSLAGLEIENGDLSVIDGALEPFSLQSPDGKMVKRSARPPGRNSGHQKAASPLRWSATAKTPGCAPPAETRKRRFPTANAIWSDSQLAPRCPESPPILTYVSSVAGPPVTATFLSEANPSKNPIH